MRFRDAMFGFLATALCSAAAEAAIGTASHLVPVRSAYSLGQTYESALAQVFECPICGHPAQVIVTPAFEQEWAIWVGPFELRHVVCLAVARRPVAPAYRESSFDPTTHRSEPGCVPISSETSDAVLEAWRTALYDVRYPDPGDAAAVLDGTGYYFSIFVRMVGPLEGTTHSPPRATRAARMIELVRALRSFADSPTPENESLVERSARRIVD